MLAPAQSFLAGVLAAMCLGFGAGGEFDVIGVAFLTICADHVAPVRPIVPSTAGAAELAPIMTNTFAVPRV